MDVIRRTLSEEDVLAIGQEMLDSLASCSTSSVMLEVRRYLSNPSTNADVVRMLKRAFAEELGEIRSESDEGLLQAVSTISSLRYGDICGSTPIDDLKRWLECINIMHGKGDFRPYKAPIKLHTIKEIVDTLKDMGFDDVAKKLLAKKNIFSEVNTARAVGTPFKGVFFKSTENEIKERGIDFLIRMKERGVVPNQWRFL